MDEILKELFGDGELNFENFNKKITEKGLKIADISKGDYVAKKKYEDEINSLNKKFQDVEEQNKKLINDKNANKTETEKQLESLTTQFEALKLSNEKNTNDLENYRKKETLRKNGINDDRVMNFALYELKDSKDFEADLKNWSEKNKQFISNTNPKGDTIPPLNGNPEKNEEKDPFLKGLKAGAGIEQK